MLDSNTAPLVEPTRHTSPRRGVRSGSDGYPRATVLLQSNQGRQSYQLYDDFNYEEPSPKDKQDLEGHSLQRETA